MLQRFLTSSFFPSFLGGSASAREVPGPIAVLGTDVPLTLDCGDSLGPYRIAYQTWGALNADRSNAILVCHALTDDQFLAGTHPLTGKKGWWHAVVGPGLLLDTNKYFVICSNILGGCMGSEGPAQIHPETGRLWGLSFPVITIHDMVRAQKALIDHLGIPKLFMVTGSSMGGMQALSWSIQFPDSVRACAVLASGARFSAQNIAFHEVGRQAIMSDPLWHKGAYSQYGTHPKAGLSVARMAAHITYASAKALQEKFGRRLQDRPAPSFGFDADFQIESYLRHQGESFVARFDPNAYLYVTRAVDYCDLASDFGGGALLRAFANSKGCRYFVGNFTSDWLFPPIEGRTLADAILSAGAAVSYVELESEKGHEAFVSDVPAFYAAMSRFIDHCALSFFEDERAVSPLPPPAAPPLSPLLRVIVENIPQRACVLDVGCGDGTVLRALTAHRAIKGTGIEIDAASVTQALTQGVSVFQGDANALLLSYPKATFDVALLIHSLSEMRDPVALLRHLARLTPRVLVIGTNLAFLSARLYFMFLGRSPMTKMLPRAWFDTPKIRFYTLEDFSDIADRAGYRVARREPLCRDGSPLPRFLRPFANLLAVQCLYELVRREAADEG